MSKQAESSSVIDPLASERVAKGGASSEHIIRLFVDHYTISDVA